ncbi:5'-nucleotidase [Actinokineospora alba]|uniref:5'-nucleotidase n=1 Tax=Actinokineospora alba TaxID=504798 RepID=A0A1H0TID4_9PSEU|nr:bifunctional metallophosphatase/5'-nucleotidase [Actinokineospora alba]TDP70534.1 5'-nucleotidase [Actinokineospora alba]SDJ09281.1 5'-nucleotidase [Actinokineospora alba]SDP53797.1 5'-nucleotidase [Actinokineospora alba]
MPGARPVLRYAMPVALAAAVMVAIPLTSPSSGPQAEAWTPMSPVAVDYAAESAAGTARGRLLGFNDFHGALEPPIGSGGLVNGNPAGGVEYLATYVERLRAQGEANGEKVLTVGAGDLVGATPLISAAFHDEPSIEVLSALGLNIASVGNHEFDEGVDELKRLQNGGCHPVDGCQDGDGFDGADFRYLSANVVDKQTRKPILRPYEIKMVQGVPVAFVGMTLEGTPSIVNPAGIASVDFLDEIETANSYAGQLSRLGIKSMVLLIHEGGQQNSPPTPQDPSSCANFAGPITNIVAGLRPEYGLVVSGHTHRFYSCALPNSSGANSVVTSAGSNGTLVTDIGVKLDRKTRKFTNISARNVIVENGVKNADGTWAKDAQGNFIRNPDLVNAAAKAIVDKYRAAVAPLANKVVGSITADITRAVTAAGESALGDVIADAQLAYTSSQQAQIALMNPGGIRADLSYAFSPGGEQPGQVTYGEAFTVQPFNNLVVTQTLTGAQLKEVLEQQFAGYAGQATTKFLQVSAGFSYSYDTTLALGSRVSQMAYNGVPIDPAASYKVTSNDFLANGGDGFTKLSLGTGRVYAPGFDVDALVAHLTNAAPVAPGPRDRITKIA